MSQKPARKSQNPTIIVISDDNEKAETPVKEMKKKIAANAEKDKQAADKTEKPTEKTDKSEPAEKSKAAEKTDKNENKPDKNADKTDKSADKSEKAAEKKSEKTADKKSDKSADKKTDKPVEKKVEQAEKDESKGDKSKEKPRALNGHSGAAAANGDDANGTVSDGSDGDLVIEEDEAFPELAYDDSDTDAEDAPSRSLTRRSQVKVTKTPETPAPRPASDREGEDSKESKVLKLTDSVAQSDRKLRSADSPKPDSKKKAQDSPKKQDNVQEEEKISSKKDLEATKKDQEDAGKEPKDGKPDEKEDKMEVEVVTLGVESAEGCAPRTRARVSPYSRTRLDRTATSVTADYTGNNSTMEMDITESSSFLEEGALNDSGYLRGLRGIRGRTSYKLLKDLKLTNPNAGRPRPPPAAATVRPTGAVVGRKRKPSADSPAPEPGAELGEDAADLFGAHGKRMRLLDRLALPFRRSLASRAAEIVGINTDLPLAAPVASTSFAAFDPETIKPAPPAPPAPGEPVATPLPVPPALAHDRDGKRCVLM